MSKQRAARKARVTVKVAAASLTVRGTPRKTSAERGESMRKAWRKRWRDGTAEKAAKKKLLTRAERSERAIDGWETRRKNQKAADRKAAKLRKLREATRAARKTPTPVEAPLEAIAA